MKKSILQITLVLVSIAAFSLTSTAAKKVYEGYVITVADEKMEGSIEMLSPSLNEVKVKFTSKDGKKKIFKAKEVKEYSFQVERWNHETREHYNATVTYVKKNVERAPIAFGPTNVLIERQEGGAINMYNHFVEQNSNVQTPFVHIVYVEKTANELVEVTKNNYRKVLKEMMADYPEMAAKVGSRGYGHKQVATMIATYNNWMADNGEEIVLGMR